VELLEGEGTAWLAGGPAGAGGPWDSEASRHERGRAEPGARRGKREEGDDKRARLAARATGDAGPSASRGGRGGSGLGWRLREQAASGEGEEVGRIAGASWALREKRKRRRAGLKEWLGWVHRFGFSSFLFYFPTTQIYLNSNEFEFKLLCKQTI
jgi:hypothetical protein